MTQLVILQSNPLESLAFNHIVTVDLSTFGLEDYISLSLPEYPADGLVPSQCFIDFTSDPDGTFSKSSTDSIPFSAAEPSLPTSGSEDIEMRLPISLLTTCDKAVISGVRIRLWSTEAVTFRCLGIRACSKDWVYAPIDLNTLWDKVSNPYSPDGSASPSIEFPINEGEQEPTDFPIVIRSNRMRGFSDPMPVNMKVGLTFVAGSLENATGEEDAFNAIAAYFRDISEDDQTMIELNGDGTGLPGHGFNQDQLNSLGHQPDFGRARFKARLQRELDEDVMSQIDDLTQWGIEHTPDETGHSYIEVKLKWSSESSSNTLTILDAEGQGYSFSDIPIVASSDADLEKGKYMVLIDLQDNVCQVDIYKLDQVNQVIGDPVFSTGRIFNDDLFRRRKGRVGWWAQFIDGDASFTGFRTRGMNFGELRSKVFRSFTPVKGVSIYAGSTSDVELVKYLATTDADNTSVRLDSSLSDSGSAYQITTTADYPRQGATTNWFKIDDPANLDISFDLNLPGTNERLQVYLINSYQQIIPLHFSHFYQGQWTHVKIIAPREVYQTGYYRLVLTKPLPFLTPTWYLDRVSVKAKSVKWQTRAVSPTPWETDKGWQEVGFTLNALNGGVVFDRPGAELQVAGQMLRQDAKIHDFKAAPQYATLGRIVWPDASPSVDSPPVVGEISSTVVEGRTYQFEVEAADGSGYLTYLWSFGDGSYDAGQEPTHTYTSSGTYEVVAYVTDNFGNTVSELGSIVVS